MKRLLIVGGRFLIVGGLSTIIEIAVFNITYVLFGWDVVTAKVVASLVALVNAYFGNREWVFRHRDRRHRGLEITLFLVTNGLCTALGAWILAIGTQLAGNPGPLIVNVINLVSIAVIVVVRFVLYHYVVFRAKPGRRTGSAPSFDV